MKTRSFPGVCVLVLGLVSAPLMAGCAAASPEEAEDTGAATEALSVPDESFDFSEKLEFCETVDLGITSPKLCSPSVSFAGSVTLGDYGWTIGDLPASALVTLDMNAPFHLTESVRVGLESDSGGVCFDAVDADGFTLKLCADAVHRSLNTSARKLSFNLKLTVDGSIGVDGVGVSEDVKLYETPTITLSY